MPKISWRRKAFIFAGAGLLLNGCSVGPDYVPPAVPQPAQYQEKGPWKRAEPRDDISKGDWYTVFHDKKLNELEAQAQLANQSLRAAAARVSEARALARQTEASFFPSVDFNATGSRQRTSPNNGQLVAQSPEHKGQPSTFTSATVVPFDLSYEVDIWGQVRRAFESAGESAQASLADFENALLSLKAELATDYFALRTADAQIDVQERTIKSYQENLDLNLSRFQGGISTQLDVEQAKATLASAQAQLASLNASRAQLLHAIAVLVGVPPEGFVLKFSPLDTGPPPIPSGLPSDLLERRPDVAAAERRVAAQNAQIGVAIGAYFPQLTLTGTTGFDSGDLGLLFNWESRIWSYGPSIQFPVFEGGRIAANIKQQRAAYEENVADYRQAVLVAFQDVEDSLSSLRYLAQQEEAENRAFVSYKNALDLTNQRYTTGLVSYFDVIQAQGLELGAEQLTVQIKGNQIATTIQLIKALGGGWADSPLMQPQMGNHVAGPSAAPTVLGPVNQQAVPQAVVSPANLPPPMQSASHH
ncbi:MAG TPA: efflux transporter outer membrane subunit [Candidatus Methylacidiphilales bacterium]|nr:efflux transporter outer membrane subunit [Candidatus Methylacidiphilales bacterium]